MKIVNRISRITGMVLLLAFVSSQAQTSGVPAQPRDGLFGVSRDSYSALYAIDLATTPAAAQQNGTIDGRQLSALAKDPTTGVLYGFGTDGTTVSMVTIDPRRVLPDGTGPIGIGNEFEVKVAAGGHAAPGALIDVLGADFNSLGELYVALEFSDSTTGKLETWPATITMPQPGDTQVYATLESSAFQAQFIKGIAFDPRADLHNYQHGILWAVSPNAGSESNTLFEYDDPTSISSGPSQTISLKDTSGHTPPAPATDFGGGFGSLQFTCDGKLYGGTLEKSYLKITAKSQSNRLGDFSITYEDVNGDGLLEIGVDTIVAFSGLDVGSNLHFDEVVHAPDLDGVSALTGDAYTGDYWWFTASDGRTKPNRYKKTDWTYTVTTVYSGTGGHLYTIDLGGTVQDVLPATDNGASLSGLAGVTSCNTTSVQDAPTPPGPGVTFSLQSVQEQLGDVEGSTTGSTTLDFCVVGPDPRELGGHYNPGYLTVSELPVVKGDANCKDLVSQIDLTIAPWYRGFVGTVKKDDGQTATGVYFILELSQYKNVDTDGPTVILAYPQALINYSGQSHDPTTGDLACSDDANQMGYRPLGLGGTIAAAPFNDFPNVEGTDMIADTVQCDGFGLITQRTTHIWPMRLDGQQANGETINMQRQQNGINKTIQEGYGCANSTSTLDAIQQQANEADNDWTQGDYAKAVAAYEQIARLAKGGDWSGCQPDVNGVYRNYKGNFMMRGLTAAFTVYDRYLHPTQLGWSEYKIPSDLNVPLLDPTSP